MIARGPTLASDRETATGSLHVLGLPSLTAATEFVEREPNNRAGVYARHRIWSFENVLGRTMWAFTGDSDEPRFLIVAEVGRDRRMPDPPRTAAPSELGAELRERLIVYGTRADPESGETPTARRSGSRARRDTSPLRRRRLRRPRGSHRGGRVRRRLWP